MRPSIHAKLDKKDCNLDNWQVVVKQTVDTKAKAAWQAPLLVRKSNVCCFCNQRYPKNKKSKDQKDSEANKKYLSTNNNSRNKNRG